jgi:hypothetical protein
MTLTPDRQQIELFVNALFRYAERGFVQMRAFRDTWLAALDEMLLGAGGEL